MTKAITILLVACNVFFACAQKKAGQINFKIGLLAEGVPADEQAAVLSFLQNQKDFDPLQVKYEQIQNKSFQKLKLTHLWIHKRSTARPTQQEIAAGKKLKSFVAQGGTLILSMEAVRLLNDWGIEKNTFEVKTDSVIDEGFGRPLGFHAFKSHPIFDGLNGGVYSWKGKKDHVIRKIGFFNSNLPDTSIAKVIGIEWTYITFHEQNKLVMEYRLGKGRIIAVGAYSYFAAENFNTLQLHRFYRNIFYYTAGHINSVKANYWNYDIQKVNVLKRKFSSVPVKGISKWNLPELSIQIKKAHAAADFISLAGRRMLVMGKQKGGIDEVWTHPFMSFRDVEAAVVLKGADTAIWLKDLTPSITVSPELLTREYDINGTIIKEITTVSMDKPVAVLHYECQGPVVEKILMRYTTNFRYMWPYSDKVSASVKYKWTPEMNAVISTAQKDDLAGIMGFSSPPADYKIGQFKDAGFEKGQLVAAQTNLVQLSGIFSFNASGLNGCLSAYMLAGNEGIDKAVNMYRSESAGFEQVFQKTSAYFKALLKHSMSVTTPDERFNTGYKWAMVRADQFFQETPGLGTSLMAGFGTTARGWDGGQKISGRPGYAWYFGRDAQWSGMAINACGGYPMIKKTLQVFADFQDLNGKIYHELTSSGAVHYDASDATPLYVVLAASYLKYSGDLDYIRKIWPSLTKAMDFCYSTDTDHDGLIEITNVGHGWIEGGPLFGAHTEIYLAGCWVAALDAASYMSAALKDKAKASVYKGDADKVRKIIDKEFWNSKGQYFYNGKMIDGSFMKDQTVLSSVPIYFNAISDSLKAAKTTASFSGNEYSTDWGLRILPESNPHFNPGAYHAGMVWPLFTGFAALAEYKTGNYASGFSHIMDNLMLYRNWSLGSTEETLNGLMYLPAGICSQQGWSETMVLQPIAEGMLGLACDALSDHVSLSPRFPHQWNQVSVENIAFGTHRFNLRMLRDTTSTFYTFSNFSGAAPCNLAFNPSFLPGTSIESVSVNGKEMGFDVRDMGESTQLILPEMPVSNELSIKILHKGGIGLLPLINEPKAGAASQELKILKQKLEGKRYIFTVEGLKDRKYEVSLVSRFNVKSVAHAEILSHEDDLYRISIHVPNGNGKYARQNVVLELL